MQHSFAINRRSFVKTFTWTTAGSSLLGKAWTSLLTLELGAATSPSVGTLRLSLQDFPALLSESGSVRLVINPLSGSPPNGPRPIGAFYPVVINRGPNNTFYALSSKCTHQNCVVDPMDAASNEIVCPCHNSHYAIDGKRLSGPALGNLTRYTIIYDGQDTLEVQIPSLGYSVTASTVPATATTPARMQLDFNAQRNVTYEVHFRESMDQASIPALFSLTAEGTADQTTFTPTANTSASLFVEPASSTSGFFQIAVQVIES